MRATASASLLCCAILAAASLAALATATAIPQFAQSFTVGEQDSIAIYQGNYAGNSSLLCCPAMSNCKIQTEMEAGINYVDAVGNRTRFDTYGSDQSIISDYPNNKQMLVQNGTCQSYCPLDEDWTPFGIGPNATFIGTKVINGVKCNGYQWKDTILGIVTMEVSTFWVNENVNPPQPVEEDDVLTPFGQPLGTSSSSWSNFVAGRPDPSLFVVQNEASCPLDSGCNSDAAQRRRMRKSMWQSWTRINYMRKRVSTN